MKNKKDTKVILGILIIIVIAILSIWGYKQFGNSVAVPQITDSGIEQYDVKFLPTGSELLGNKNTNTMTPIQVIKKENGLIIEIIEEGIGEQARSGDNVSVDYRGMFTDGNVFDESYSRGQQFSFVLDGGMVIKGWDEGVLGMKVGEKRRITVPSSLGYGPNDYGPIPGGSTLIFDIELHKIN